ncbi:putative methyltransferase-like protein C27D7.08c [Ceratocystis fimbriata CBS 114723]|uniref:Putative methyltransferase-like protein C27D7.08c n=1 Tax=Ceratocystis fimbriata CBS 114723 TaxID=1035309 RepID=A0A2C5WUN5_9PEZI|nr:putative methyltransferase-like protein C27D7.08c [Ceratocystis fimbriata CBS 114723]
MSKRKHSYHGQDALELESSHSFPSPGPESLVDKDTKFANLYKTEPNFRELAGLDPAFAPYPDAVMQLTTTLLSLDFGLRVELPQSRLCPMVHNRHNYILWLKDLVDSSLPAGFSQSDVVGLDIGTGSSCIYPLLGCAQRPWSFIATGWSFFSMFLGPRLGPLMYIDPLNIQNARANVSRNGLDRRIRIVPRTQMDPLVALSDFDLPSLTFTMTNPPFYESLEDLKLCAEKKLRPPLTACTGSAVEMVTVGGESGFAERILTESLELQQKVRWYTIMFGKQSSVETLVKKLRDHKVSNYAITEFVQGSRTRRWAVAWSFCPQRPAQSSARGLKVPGWKGIILPPLTEVEVASLPSGVNPWRVATTLRETLEGLDLKDFSWDMKRVCATGKSAQNVWSRAYRRRKQRGEDTTLSNGGPDPVFGFKVWISVGVEKATVYCRWTEGYDETTFASFQGYLKTIVTKAVEDGKDRSKGDEPPSMG